MEAWEMSVYEINNSNQHDSVKKPNKQVEVNTGQPKTNSAARGQSVI